MLQVEDGYAAEGVPHEVVSRVDPGFCRFAGKLARWGAGSERLSSSRSFTHVPEPDADVSGEGGRQYSGASQK